MRAAVLYDPIHHAGVCWRGLAAPSTARHRITLWACEAAHDTDPRRVQVGIGPSIGPQSYEVGPEVAALAALHLPDPDATLDYANGADANFLRPVAG
ncbi:MAG: laccase domain-containing protein [Caldilineaceae bacterium]|nr:laccase domain-containing protein [Caldilineaceae bacterium]